MTTTQVDDSVLSRGIESIRRACPTFLIEKLDDKDVIEIMLNSDGMVYVDTLSNGMFKAGEMSARAAETIIRTVAGLNEKTITIDKPFLECNFPLDQSRFAAQLPPIVTKPTFAIRKRAIKVFTLKHYVESNIMSDYQYKVIQEAIKQHRNILICGGTGSGKTTLLNSVIQEMVDQAPLERIVIMEDTPEIQSTAENCVVYKTSSEMDMASLIKITLRMRPDRILVGEVRGAEALSLMESWNTGHEGGAATIHCNSAADGINRLILMVSKHQEAPRAIESLIASVVDIIIFIKKEGSSRKVTEIIQLDSYTDHKFNFSTLI